MYGASAVNCSLLGIGERTGNVPLEAMVFEYASLRGHLNGMNPEVITEIAEYIQHETNYNIPPMTPFVGANFNLTRAGIHADGMMKNPEIYNIFDTATILNRPPKVSVNSTSGIAGVAFWVNEKRKMNREEPLDKRHPIIQYIYDWVTAEYDAGRITMISDDELNAKYEEAVSE
jgi:isopropylmalate/homocitrate/citramalate synthase